MITANRTFDGAVIYRTAAKNWSTDLSDAAIVRNADEARALLAESVADDLGAVGAYIAPVEIRDGGKIDPGNLREYIRSRGVTIDLSVPALEVNLIMYAYDELDRTLINERVAEFRDQVKRRLSGELTEDEFKMLRLQNGVYLQLHAYMFRVAIPYGTLSSKQLRRLAHVARRYDRGYGHFTTRQNIQFNWIKLAELPDALADLAEVGIHAMQTSGNNTRNVTSDQWAGVAPGEIEDPRIWSELLRQYTTLHPEFSFLPRKFKFAITASAHDRAAIKIHDIGLRLHKNAQGETGFEVLVGGGLGRTPVHRQDHQAVRSRPRSAELCRGDPARLQSVRPPRQHLQGTHQDPGARTRRREIRSRGRGRVARDARRRADAG